MSVPATGFTCFARQVEANSVICMVGAVSSFVEACDLSPSAIAYEERIALAAQI